MAGGIESIDYSLHVRCGRAKPVTELIQEITGLKSSSKFVPARGARAKSKRRLAVSKAGRGWVSVLDSKHSEARRLGQKLSLGLKTDVFSVEARGLRSRETSRWCYEWFREGKQVDSFNSEVLHREWDPQELDNLINLFEQDPSAAIASLQNAEDPPSEKQLTPRRISLFSSLLKSRGWKDRLGEILNDEDRLAAPEVIVGNFLTLLGIDSGYSGIHYAWLFLQDQDPEDLIPSGMRFEAHLA